MKTFTVVANYRGQAANFNIDAESTDEATKIINDNFGGDSDWCVMGLTWAEFVPGGKTIEETKRQIEAAADKQRD